MAYSWENKPASRAQNSVSLSDKKMHQVTRITGRGFFFKSDQIYMKDLESDEYKEKSNFRFFRLLFFEFIIENWGDDVTKNDTKMTIPRKINIGKIWKIWKLVFLSIQPISDLPCQLKKKINFEKCWKKKLFLLVFL